MLYRETIFVQQGFFINYGIQAKVYRISVYQVFIQKKKFISDQIIQIRELRKWMIFI